MQNIRKVLTDESLDAILVTNPVNIFYLTGFRGLSPTEREAIVVTGKNKITLITARLYRHEALKLASDTLKVKIAAERDEYRNFIKETLNHYKKIGFESTNLTYAEHKKFKRLTKSRFVPTKDLVEKLRETKSDAEIQNIKKAQIISQHAFEKLTKTIKVGQTEEEIAERLLAIMKALGSQGPSFDPIVASGPNSALPHYLTGKRKVKNGDTLLLDFGARYKNYCADLSRTVFIGKANTVQRNIYNHVSLVQKQAASKTADGIKAKTVAKLVIGYFKKLDLDEHFIHSLGHGIGLEVHENPSLSTKSKDTFKNNMVFSIEPGLYFPWGGIRIEDLFAIKNGKAQILGTFSKLIEI